MKRTSSQRWNEIPVTSSGDDIKLEEDEEKLLKIVMEEE